MRPPFLQWKSVHIREVVSLERNSLLVFYYLCLKSGLIRGVAFGGRGLYEGTTILCRGLYFKKKCFDKLSEYIYSRCITQYNDKIMAIIVLNKLIGSYQYNVIHV